VSLDRRALDDLVTFAHLERDAADIEPWAEVLSHLHTAGPLDTEGLAWAVKLYNATDDLGSAFGIMDRARGPRAWAALPPEAVAAVNDYSISQERRNLRGGRLSRHLDSYAETLDGWTQAAWLSSASAPTVPPLDAFYPLMDRMRGVWGTGRQSAFEWAEFAGKTGLVKVEAPDACLWESSGPRDSLEELFGGPARNPDELNARAHAVREHLSAQGCDLPWWDFETVICDFKVMRRGRYYPGRHLGMIREEIAAAPAQWRPHLEAAWEAIVPEPWRWVEPGDRRDLRPIYARTGQIVTPFGAAS
jgi:amino acid-DNA transferase-like protein